MFWLCDDGKPYPFRKRSLTRSNGSALGHRSPEGRDSTFWTFFLDDVLQYPIERFRKELACPHVDDGELAGLYGEGGICGLVAGLVCSRATVE